MLSSCFFIIFFFGVLEHFELALQPCAHMNKIEVVEKCCLGRILKKEGIVMCS